MHKVHMFYKNSHNFTPIPAKLMKCDRVAKKGCLHKLLKFEACRTYILLDICKFAL